MRPSELFRKLGLAACAAALSLGCQVVFGDFHVDDQAFAGSSGATNATGGGGGGGGSSQVQTGPIRLMPTDGLYTSEWGGQATLSIVLNRMPTARVTVNLSTSDMNEGKVSPPSVVFTQDNWKAPQVITVTGVNDASPDGNKKYFLVTAPAQSDDPAFSGQDAIDVPLTNIDDETAGVTVVPTSGLVTSESGAQDTFTVVLNSAPGANVSIELTSSKPTEGTVSPARLEFTKSNWMAPQVVTVTGVDDAQKDGPQSYTIATAAAASDDPNYKGLDAPDVQVVNKDNETAGVTVVLVSGIDPLDATQLKTSENGDSATFTVELNAPPGDDVTIPLSSSSGAEGEVSPSSLIFTKLNWNAPQTVTVSGVDDDHTADGNQPYKVQLEAAQSKDTDYAGLDADDVNVVNVDNDTPGFSVMLMSGLDPKDPTKLVTTEAGATATFTVALTSKPKGKVSFVLSSSMPTEGTVNPGTLTFTPDNWNAPQVVSVRGVDDAEQDGNRLFSVVTGMAMSDEDPDYVLDPPDVQVTNQDDDSAGVHILLGNGIDPANPSKLVTSESGDSATFTVSLTSQPNAEVQIPISSSNTNEGKVYPATLKFTKANYGAPQTVTLTGVDDHVADGNQPYTISIGPASSTDLNFKDKFASQVQASNRDNDTAFVIVTPQSGLVTSEAGKTASFTVQLQSEPKDTVTITLSSNNPAEGKPNVNTLMFTKFNWNAPQTVTVTGQQDDGTADGDQVYKIIIDPPTSTDPNYGPTKLNPPDVTVTNLDDDSPGIIVTPVSGLTTTEGGGTATFTIALQSRPVAGVNIKLSSSRPTEGTVSPTGVSFTPANYNSPQTVTVTGVNDDAADGPQPYLIMLAAASSMDMNYNGRKGKDVSVTNIDNDSAGVRITPVPTQVPAQTTEKGGSSTFTVVLNSLPSAAVSFTLSSSNTAEGVVSPSSLTFTTVNWNAAQTVTVSGVDDNVADGDQPYKIRLSAATSMDPGYSGLFATDLPFVNVDDDHPGLVINAAAGLQTKEDGSTATFTIALLSQPQGMVTIGLSSSNTSEGTVAPTSLTFTASNWAAPQVVTVTGVPDQTADGPQPYNVLIANAVSTSDKNYNGKYGTQVPLTNVDIDQPGFTVSAATGLQTTEKGGTATFSVVLLSRPTASNTVSLGVKSSDTSEGTVKPNPLVFTTSNWSMPHVVTVTGVDDKLADGDQSYSVLFDPATSNDSGYAGKFPMPVSLTNADDDMVGVLVTPTSCSTTPGTTATFTVVLNSQPGGDVTIPLSSDTPTEGTVSPSMLTFSSANWDTAQTVTVTGVDDGTMGAMTAYKIVTGNASSAADTTGYSGFNPADVSCTNTTPPPAMMMSTP